MIRAYELATHRFLCKHDISCRGVARIVPWRGGYGFQIFSRQTVKWSKIGGSSLVKRYMNIICHVPICVRLLALPRQLSRKNLASSSMVFRMWSPDDKDE